MAYTGVVVPTPINCKDIVMSPSLPRPTAFWAKHLARLVKEKPDPTSGDLKRLIDNDGLRGVTSNPKIFDDAIEGSADYDEEIGALANKACTVTDIYESLAVADIQSAAHVLRSVYDATDGRDGYVSLEVNPHLAHDTEGTTAEARRLWKAVDRPNVFIKIPADAGRRSAN